MSPGAATFAAPGAAAFAAAPLRVGASAPPTPSVRASAARQPASSSRPGPHRRTPLEATLALALGGACGLSRPQRRRATRQGGAPGSARRAAAGAYGQEPDEAVRRLLLQGQSGVSLRTRKLDGASREADETRDELRRILLSDVHVQMQRTGGAESAPPQSATEGMWWLHFSDSSSSLLLSLQGVWEDSNMGLIIEVKDNLVDFHDGRGTWPIEESSDGVLTLRGASLTGGLPDLPAWKLPSGMTMVWTKLDPALEADSGWAERFMDYKVARMLLRQRLSAAAKAEDFDTAAALTAAWHSTWGFDKTASPEQEIRLAAGRHLVPGVCVKHTRLGYHGVVLGCEPFVRMPMARKVSGACADGFVNRLQPIYCVLVDDRDAPGGGALFLPEGDLEVCDEAFPLKGPLVGQLLEQCDEIRGYLPGQTLKEAVRRQRTGLPLILWG